MKAVALLLVVALAVCGVRAQDASAEAAAIAEPLSAMGEMPVDSAFEAAQDESADQVSAEDEESDEAEAQDESEMEVEQESEEELESESEDASESEDESGDEFSLLEAEAETESESESESEADKPKKPTLIKPAVAAKKVSVASIIRRAPKPIVKKVAPFKFHSERVVNARTSKYDDPEMAKLNLALAAVKEDILSTNKQITDERKWVIAVAKIIASYNDKMKRVEAHIIALRKEMKALYRKKKQIENLKLQRALEAKLKEAKAELATLTNSLKHVAVKQGELNKSGRDLRQTIAGIQGQLAKLRGQQSKRACRKPGTKWSRKARKCVSKCKKGQVYSAKGKKCVARCKKGAKWNAKSRKCVRRSKKGGKKSRRSRRSRSKKF